MAAGIVAKGQNTKDYGGEMTVFVLITCLVAATGGLIFGYDIGISGGVTSMDVFLKKFFPSVYKKEKNSTGGNQYCKFDSALLTSFTSSLYIAALVASFFASATTRALGRKVSMMVGGTIFLIGAILNGAAVNVEMLIIGRLLLGVGVGYANQSVPVYLSEMAPAKLRGLLNIGFQMAITIGNLVANLVNYGTNQIKGGYGWRLSLGLAGVPAIIMTIGSLLLPDTPNSLIERGHREKAKTMLQKIRGTNAIDEEFQDLVEASEASMRVQHPWRNILQPKYRPQLIMAICIPMFQQFTGINVIMFYAPPAKVKQRASRCHRRDPTQNANHLHVYKLANMSAPSNEQELQIQSPAAHLHPKHLTGSTPPCSIQGIRLPVSIIELAVHNINQVNS